MQSASPPPPPPYGVAPAPTTTPETTTLMAALNMLKLLGLIFGGLLGLVGLVLLLAGAVADWFDLWGLILVIVGVFDFLVWFQMPQVERLVTSGQYLLAKQQLNMIIIFGILGGLLIGLLVVLMVLPEIDRLLVSQQPGGGPPPTGYTPQPPPPYGGVAATPPPPPSSPPATLPAAFAPTAPPSSTTVSSVAPNCRSCGQPMTYVPQYSRYYCYGCAQYA